MKVTRVYYGMGGGYPFMDCLIDGLPASFGYEQKRLFDVGIAFVAEGYPAAQLFPPLGEIDASAVEPGRTFTWEYFGGARDPDVLAAVRRWRIAQNSRSYRVGYLDDQEDGGGG